MKHLLPVLLIFFLHSNYTHACLKWVEPLVRGCDTLVFKDGRRVAADIEKVTVNEIIYAPCDDTEGRVFVVSRTQVQEVRPYQAPPRPQIQSVEEPEPQAELEPEPYMPVPPPRELTEPEIEWSVDSALLLSIIGFVLLLTVVGSPGSLVLGLISMNRASKALRALKKLPGKRRLRRRAILAIILSGICIAGFFTLAITFIKAIQSLNFWY